MPLICRPPAAHSAVIARVRFRRPPFAAVYGGDRGPGEIGLHRTDVDDLARPAGQLIPGDLPPDQEGAGQIRGQHAVPVVQADVEQRLPVLQPGVVHQDLDRADSGFDGCDSVLHLVGIGDVERDGVRPCLAELGRQCGAGAVQSLGVHTVEHDAGAGPASPVAMARPMPRLDPVISAIRPDRSKAVSGISETHSWSGLSTGGQRLRTGLDSVPIPPSVIVALITGFDRGEGAGRAGQHDVAGPERR